jgi:hypothetical protein
MLNVNLVCSERARRFLVAIIQTANLSIAVQLTTSDMQSPHEEAFYSRIHALTPLTTQPAVPVLSALKLVSDDILFQCY